MAALVMMAERQGYVEVTDKPDFGGDERYAGRLAGFSLTEKGAKMSERFGRDPRDEESLPLLLLDMIDMVEVLSVEHGGGELSAPLRRLRARAGRESLRPTLEAAALSPDED